MSLLWISSLDEVDNVILGINNVEQIIENINKLNKCRCFNFK